MPAGLEVINDSGTIQIDPSWGNYALVQVQAITSSPGVNWGGPPLLFGAVHTGSLDSDLVFVHCTSTFNLAGVSYRNNVRQIPVGTTGAGVVVTFYVFRKQPPTASTYGLQVFDPSGVLLFDSASNFAKLVLSMPTAGNYLAQNLYFNLPANRKYAVMMPSFTGQMVESYSGAGTGGQGWYYITLNGPALVCHANGVEVKGYSRYAEAEIPIQNPPTGVRVTNYSGGDLIVADVQGM